MLKRTLCFRAFASTLTCNFLSCYENLGDRAVKNTVFVEGLHSGFHHRHPSADNICSRIRLHDRLRRVAKHSGWR